MSTSEANDSVPQAQADHQAVPPQPEIKQDVLSHPEEAKVAPEVAPHPEDTKATHVEPKQHPEDAKVAETIPPHSALEPAATLAVPITQAPTETATNAASTPHTAAAGSDSGATTAQTVPEPTEPAAPPAYTHGEPSTLAAVKSEKPDGPEPQNALTKKFTDAEWKAVKELRSNLPEILANGYPDRPDAKSQPAKLWGVTLDPNGPKDARVSVILVKFLRARHCNVYAAQEMLVATLRWRDEFKVDEVVHEQFPDEIFGQLGYNYGRDKEGRPVTYNLYGANQDLKAVFGDIQRFLRWRVALMEKSIALIDFEKVDQMIQVHDYEGVSLSSRDANSKNAASEATSIFQSHYPEMLYKKFFVNIPTYLTWIFALFKPLLSAETLAKMTVVGSGHHAISKMLLPFIDADQLPERYGGKAAAF